ncbi:MAG: hypothetical protein U9P44_03285 [archaeon]|nr:hypothetical protein [archaeon]
MERKDINLLGGVFRNYEMRLSDMRTISYDLISVEKGDVVLISNGKNAADTVMGYVEKVVPDMLRDEHGLYIPLVFQDERCRVFGFEDGSTLTFRDAADILDDNQARVYFNSVLFVGEEEIDDELKHCYAFAFDAFLKSLESS